MLQKAKYWRDAATLILAARCTNHSTSKKLANLKDAATGGSKREDYEVLMLKRSENSSFMPSRMVFPGGTLHEADHSQDWYKHFQHLTKRHSSELTKQFRISGPRPPAISEAWYELENTSADVAFRICAIRETFEESGILLVLGQDELNNIFDMMPGRELSTLKDWNHGSRPMAFEEWRSMVNKDPNAFLKLCQELKAFPNIWALYEWNNWLTPVFQKVNRPVKKPRRFDTMFYIACFECDHIPTTSADDSETVLSQWMPPSMFLSLYDDMGLDGPQQYELKRLINFQLLHRLHAFSHDRSVKGLQRCMPVVRYYDDGFISYLPGDWCYPDEPDFEGTKDLPDQISQNISQTFDEAKEMHRIIFLSGLGNVTIICNRPPPCGHVLPLDFPDDKVQIFKKVSSKL